MTIQFLQFSSHDAEKIAINHSTELRMVARIRSFLSSNVSSKTSALKDERRKLDYIDQSLEQLLLLGQLIIGPLLQTSNTDETHSNGVRRQHSYLLPLEMIPSILTAADALDDLRADMSKDLTRMEFELGMGLKQTTDENDSIDCNETKHSEQQHNNIQSMDVDQVEPKDENSTTTMHRVSDIIMTALFSSFAEHNCRFTPKPIRADAALPVLALAVDGIGSGRMASVCPAMNNGQNATYWDCLRQTLDEVISFSILCCNDASTDEIRSQEGIHIIPHADYPALVRCIFRMVSSNNSNSSTINSMYPSCESLLLRSYHATVATVLSAKLARLEKYRDSDPMTILSTVQSHVLLPIFVGSSVLSIRSILNRCATDSCSSCMKDSAVPSHIVAGFVLLIMRSRISTAFHSVTNSASSFDPRSIIRMATEAMLKETDNLESHQDETDKRFDNEFDMALKVLLSLSEIDSGSCPKCSEVNANNEGEVAAYEVLKESLYKGDNEFVCRYENPIVKEKSYYDQLGVNTLLSYANLIRSSLTQGLTEDSEKHHSVETFVTDTAKTWLDAAMMLLDDFSNRANKSQNTNITPKGSAFAVVILLVIFFEVPSSQHEIIRSLYDRLQSSASSDCSNDSLIVAISTLAWSMVSRDNNSSKVFSRKDDMVRCNMAIFEPLCSLLSVPVSSSGDCFGRFFTTSEALPISYSSAFHIAKSLITVPSAREGILSMAKKHMRVFTAVRSAADPSLLANTFIESMPCTQASNRDSTYFAVACLCMLIEKHRYPSIPTVDDCGFEALMIVTDLIVYQYSDISAQMPRSVSSWILAELNYSALNAKQSLWVCQRILRACLFSLIRCCNVEQEGLDSHRMNATFLVNNPSLMGNVDFVGLLRLSTTLFEIVYGASMAPTNAQLVATLLHKEQGVASKPIEEGVRALENKVDVYNKSSEACIDRALFGALFEGAARILHDKISSAWEPSNLSEVIEQYIFASEQYHYKHRGTNDHYRHSFLPDWLKTKHRFERGFTDPNVAASEQEKSIGNSFSCQKKQTVCLLCDFFVESLARGFNFAAGSTVNIAVDMSDKDNDAFAESDLLLGVNFLWEKRQQTSVDVKVSIPSAKLYHLLNIYSRQLQLIWKEPQRFHNISYLESTIKHAMDFCMIISSAKHAPLHKNQYAAIWSLYCSVADEASSCSLIALLLDVYKKSGWAPVSVVCDKKAASKVNARTLSLTSIWSDDMLDEQLLHIRISMLSSLTSCELSTMCAHDEKNSLLELLFQSLQKLCTDLSDGFQGHSGGMVKSLFRLYIEAIERCIESISIVVDNVSVTDLYENLPNFTALNGSLLILWNMFCEECFKETFVIKAILKLSVDMLPALTRKIEIIARRRVDCDTHLMPCVILLDQANAALQMLLKDTGTVTANGDVFETETGKATNTIDFTKYPITQLITPKLTSANAIAWSHNIAFISMSSIWNELSKTIVFNRRRHLATRCYTDQMLFTKHRLGTFQSLHSCICKMFGNVDSNVSNETKEGGSASIVDTPENARVIADLLSHRGKSHLCTCLEKMSIAFSGSIKKVTAYFNHQANLLDWRLFEAFACAIGCMSSIVSKSSSYDAITGPVRWFAAESQAENYAVIHRLHKTIYRCETVEMDLQNLYAIVQRLDDKDHSALKERIHIFDEMAFSSTLTDTGGLTFSVLLEQSVKVVQSRMASLQTLISAAGLISDGDGGNSDEDDFLLNTTRGQSGFSFTRSRRMQMRSRNETIDDWLALDDEFAGTGGEVYNNDTFVDLEDFIVDG